MIRGWGREYLSRYATENVFFGITCIWYGNPAVLCISAYLYPNWYMWMYFCQMMTELMSVLVSDFVVSMQKMYCEVLNLIVRKLFNTFSTILFLSFSDEITPYFIFIIKFSFDCSFSSTFLVLFKHDSACKGLFLYKIMLLVKNNIIALNAFLCLRDSYQ